MKQEKKHVRKDFFLETFDIQGLNVIKAKIGALSESQAVRFAIRETAKRCKQ